MPGYFNSYVVKLNGRELFFILTWIVCSFFYWLTSSAAIPLSHDWEYAYKFTEQSVWQFSIEHYTKINGRVLVHLLIGLFAPYYPLWIAVNAAFICGLPLLLMKIVKGPLACWPLSYSMLLLAWLAIMLGFPNAYYQVGFFWLTGSLNYVWPTLMALLLFHYLWGPGEQYQQWSQIKFVSILMIAFLTAGSHEQISMLVIGFSFTRLAWDYWQDKPFSPRLVMIAFAAIAGALILFLAPGNFVRLENTSLPSLFDRLTVYSSYLTRHYFTNSRLHLLPLLFILTQGLLFWSQPSKTDSRLIRIGLLCIVIFLLAGSLIVALVNTLPIQLIWLAVFWTAQFCISIVLARQGETRYSLLLLAMMCSQLVLLALPPDSLGPRSLIPTLLLMSTLTLWGLALWLNKYRHGGGFNHIYPNIGLFIVLTAVLIQVFPRAIGIHKYYAENQTAHLLNNAKIQVWRNSTDASKPLYLERLPNLPWEMPYSNPYFIEYFYYYHELPPETVVIWTGINTDERQRSSIVNLRLLHQKVAKSNMLLTTGPGKFVCNLQRLNQFVIFSHNSWGCSKHAFEITIFSKEGKYLGHYREDLYSSQYIPSIHNLTGNYSNHLVYTLPKLEDGYATIEWLGATVTVY